MAAKDTCAILGKDAVFHLQSGRDYAQIEQVLKRIFNSNRILGEKNIFYDTK